MNGCYGPCCRGKGLLQDYCSVIVPIMGQSLELCVCVYFPVNKVITNQSRLTKNKKVAQNTLIANLPQNILHNNFKTTFGL